MRSKGLSPHDVVAAIRNRGLSATELSRRLSPTGDRTAVSKALRKPWPRLNRAIAEFIGRPIHEIWPQWFAADGSRIRQQSNCETSIITKKRERQNGRAA